MIDNHKQEMKLRLTFRKYSNELMVIGLVLVTMATMTACGLPQWIATAQSILPVAVQMALGIISLIAALSGKTLSPEVVATLDSVVGKIQLALQDLANMVSEYNSNPSTTLLGEIEAGTKAVIDNITQLLADTGITDAATQSKVVNILNLILEELVAWGSLLPLLKAQAGETHTITVPLATKEFKAKYNTLLNTPTGSATVDAALAGLKRL